MKQKLKKFYYKYILRKKYRIIKKLCSMVLQLVTFRCIIKNVKDKATLTFRLSVALSFCFPTTA